MNKLEVNLCGMKLKNPVIAASGTFGFGREYSSYFDLSKLGAISSKGLTLKGSKGNKGIRIWESDCGLINSIGLENPGVEAFIKEELPFMREGGAKVIVNLGGHSKEDYIKGIELLNEESLDMIELNISCPNVKEGGMAFGMEEKSAYEIVKIVKEISKHKIMVKLSPNAFDIVKVAKAVEEAGADAISLVNTFLAFAIDVKNKKKVFDNTYAGLSGNAIKPIALRMVHQVCNNVKIPVVGLGGISSYEDALEFIMAGASAIQVGSATFNDPYTMVNIINGLEKYVKEEKLNNILDIKGIV